MTDDELLLIYKGLRDMNEAMRVREAALDKKTATLDAAVAQLGKVPEALGRQTSQYIAEGVRKSIQDDFSRPLAEAVKGPIADLSRETYHAREIMAEVGKESRLQTWKWISIMVLCGIIIGVCGSYYFYNQTIGRISDRLDSIQQQIAPPAPVPDAKPIDSKPGKGRKGH